MRFRQAETVEEKIEALQEMMSVVPKHKGTDHLRADLRRKLSKLKEEAQSHKGAAKGDSAFRIPKAGAGQAVVIGPTNTGNQPWWLPCLRLRPKSPPSPEPPFRGTQPAAEGAQPGDTITVHAGIYRERVHPPRGGRSDADRIVYRAAPGETPNADVSEVTPGIREVLGLRLVGGRWLGEPDDAAAQLVAVINETMARRYFPGRDAVGSQFRIRESDPPITVVGVVADARYRDLSGPPAMFFRPLAQGTRPTQPLALVARVAQPAVALRQLRQIFRDLDAELPEI